MTDAPQTGNPPPGYHSVSPYLIASDAPALIDFFTYVFGATERRREKRADGGVGHTELTLGDAVIMLAGSAEGFPPITAMLHIYVDDVDACYARAIEKGAKELRAPADAGYGDRMGGFTEPAGNQIWIATRLAG